MKQFLNYQDQIVKLRSKGLIVSDEVKAIEKLKQTSYFALINGYKKAFKSNNGNYIIGTRFEHIVSLYDFDIKLSELFLKNILIFERGIKSHISYYFSEKYPNSYHDYLNVLNYDYADDSKRIEINNFICILYSIYNRDQSQEYMKHYMKKHNKEVPLWVLVKVMTFGNISKMYSLLQQKQQDDIASEYKLKNSQLSSILSFLTYFRNVCAHNERLYNYHTRMEIPQDLFSGVGITTNSPRNNLFSVAVCFRNVLPKENFNEFIIDLTKIIDSFSLDGCPVTGDDILCEMGFAKNWKHILCPHLLQTN